MNFLLVLLILNLKAENCGERDLYGIDCNEMILKPEMMQVWEDEDCYVGLVGWKAMYVHTYLPQDIFLSFLFRHNLEGLEESSVDVDCSLNFHLDNETPINNLISKSLCRWSWADKEANKEDPDDTSNYYTLEVLFPVVWETDDIEGISVDFKLLSNEAEIIKLEVWSAPVPEIACVKYGYGWGLGLWKLVLVFISIILLCSCCIGCIVHSCALFVAVYLAVVQQQRDDNRLLSGEDANGSSLPMTKIEVFE